MRRDEIITLLSAFITWVILLIEVYVFQLPLALPLSIIWSIYSLVLVIKYVARYAISFKR